MTTRPHIVVIGGGIRGASLAAFLSLSQFFDISLIEKDSIGAGISSRNHGRSHSGAWNFRRNTCGIVNRNRLSSEMLRRLPGVINSASWGYYCIESDKDVPPFLAFCEDCGLLFRLAGPSQMNSFWIQKEDYAAIIEIPEFSFNPAQLAARFAELAIRTGHCRLWLSKAEVIDKKGDVFRTSLVDGHSLDSDIVINALGGWVNDIRSDLNLPRLRLQFNRWRLLVLRSDILNVPPLDRVITIEPRSNRPVSALPHTPWVVFGCDMPADRLKSPEDTPIENVWRAFDPEHPMDHLLMEAHAKHFPILRDLPEQKKYQSLFSCSGVYPELASASEASTLNDWRNSYEQARMYENPDVLNYFVLFGGSATTAILDAAEAANMLINKYIGAHLEPLELAERALDRFPAKEIGRGMIWQRMHGVPL